MEGIEGLRRDALAELVKVESQISIKDGGIRQKLRVKTKQLKKGKEKTKDFYTSTLQVSSDATKAAIADWNRKIAVLQGKIADYEALIEERRQRGESVLEAYTAKIQDLYESEDELTYDDLNLPTSYHEKVAQRDALKASIARYDAILKKDADERKAKVLAEFMAQKAKEDAARKALAPKPEAELKKPKKVILVKKSYTEEEFAEFEKKRKINLEAAWLERKRRIIHSMEPMPNASDPFFNEEAKEVLEPGEYSVYTRNGSFYDLMYSWRNSVTEDVERTREINEAAALREAEEKRAKYLEDIKKAPVPEEDDDCEEAD